MKFFFFWIVLFYIQGQTKKHPELKEKPGLYIRSSLRKITELKFFQALPSSLMGYTLYISLSHSVASRYIMIFTIGFVII